MAAVYKQQYRVSPPLPGVPELQTSEASALSGVLDPVHEKP
jgi:hypothetical protein